MGKVLSTLVICLSLVAPLWAQTVDPFSVSWDEQVRTVQRGDPLPISVLFQIPSGHYLYEDKTALSLEEGEGVALESLSLSPSVLKYDRFSGKKLQIFEEFAMATAHLTISEDAPLGRQRLLLEVQYQGCSPKLCFRQVARPVAVELEVTGDEQAVTSNGRAPGLGDRLQESLQARGWMAYVLAFVGGVLTFFTPCVLPLIPLTLAVIGIRREKSHRRNFQLTAVLVLGMAFTYAVFGVLASILGFQLGFLFQNPLFLVAGALLFFVLALGMFGLYELQVPLFLRNRLAKVGSKGYTGALLSGMTLGLLAAPCVGPVIGALLVWVAQTQDIGQGFGLLFVYGLGMGSLILLIGTFYGALAGKLHGGKASLIIKWILGFLLLVPAAYYAWVAYRVWQPVPRPAVEVQTSQFHWEYDFDEAVRRAAAENKQIFVDFWAEWCLPCLEWDEVVFSKPTVQRALADDFVAVKVDCTQNTPACTALVKRYGIVGWPTILISDVNGVMVRHSKIVGEVFAPDEFLDYLKRFSAQSP